MNSPFLLGTRGSQLALIQARLVMDALHAAKPDLACEPFVIKTSGDWKPEDGEKRLAESEGGKGLFVKEIEQALMDGRVQVGVHSLKDVPSFLPEGLAVDHMIMRADPRDALISHGHDDVMALPSGARVGTASLRRQAILKKLRPDLIVVPLRGNVTTRIDKLRSGQVDAIILANAGLSRLGPHVLPLADLTCTLLDPAFMLPACGQGIIGLESRVQDKAVRACLDAIHHEATGLCAFAERRVLQVLDGSCHTPIGAYATLDDGQLFLRAMVAAPDGSYAYQGERAGSVATRAEAEALAQDLGDEVRSHAPDGLLPERRTGT